MTECQGCGAWNDERRVLCVLCGAPLAEIDEWDPAAEPPPLPPLPDGGLGVSMPTWLREPPPPPAVPAANHAAALPVSDAPLGPRADPRTFLTDDDFPQWLRDLAARRRPIEQRPAPSAGDRTRLTPREPAAIASDRAEPVAATPAVDPALAPVAAPSIPAHDLAPVQDDGAAAAAPVPVPAAVSIPPTAIPRPRDERRRREPRETLLLAALLVGIAAAVLWALIANGAFRLGP